MNHDELICLTKVTLDEEHAVFGFYLFQQAFHCHSLIPSRHSQFRSTKSLCSFIQFTSQQFAFTRCFGLRDLRRNWRAKGCKHRYWLTAVSFLPLSVLYTVTPSFGQRYLFHPPTHQHPPFLASVQCVRGVFVSPPCTLVGGFANNNLQRQSCRFFLWSFVVDAALSHLIDALF